MIKLILKLANNLNYSKSTKDNSIKKIIGRNKLKFIQ